MFIQREVRLLFSIFIYVATLAYYGDSYMSILYEKEEISHVRKSPNFKNSTPVLVRVCKLFNAIYAMEAEKERPNIRIEIFNEGMDVDVDESENEDGEIVEDEPVPVPAQPNSRTVFTTGINIFDHEEQKKLQERAKRFALKPEETYSFTDADLVELRESLGITEDNELEARLDTVLLLGTTDMQVEDILDYFAKYAPSEIEFVDEHSVNVKWLENITAARAMFYSSRAVKDMPVREQVLGKDFLDSDVTDEKDSQSVLLRGRDIQLQVDDIVKPAKKVFKNAVDMDQITIPIPPGYWRLGDKHPKAKCLLLRYAFKTDKKPYRTESLARYYKKLGTAKIHSDKWKEGSIFERNRDLPKGKNPWGNLAKNWDQDAKFRENIPTPAVPIEVKNPNLATRLGHKAESENELEIVEEPTATKKPKVRSMRMRMYADEEEERIKMKKAIQKLKTSSEKLLKTPKDLRAVLSLNNITEPLPVPVKEPDDLGKKLKNRSRQMVFSLESDVNVEKERKENIRTDMRTMLNRRKLRSPIRDPINDRRYRDRSPVRRHESPSRGRRLTSERLVHYRRHQHEADEERTKPKSKVTVVIKKQKPPTVASTIWSKVQESESDESSSGSDEETSKSDPTGSSSSSEESELDNDSSASSEEGAEEPVKRPGFDYYRSKLVNRNYLKVVKDSDGFRRRYKE